jgi:TolA-binding protein|tara:strand:- start:93 stop:377 length:285 start_codon:yes stop_codon:yes gene_type:complete
MNDKKFTDTGDGAIRVTAQYDGTMLKQNNPPPQKGENPDLEVINDNKRERINDLEDRIEFLQSDISEEAGPTKRKADMVNTLKNLKSKLEDLKS